MGQPSPEIGADMTNFINMFLSYGVLMLVTVIACGIAIFLGITLRKKKDASAAAGMPVEETAKEEA